MRMIPRNDEKSKGPSCRNKGGAYSREGAARDEEFVLQYLRSTLQAIDKEKFQKPQGVSLVWTE